MTVSKQAEECLKKKCGWKRKTCIRMAQRVFDKGTAHSQTRGRLRKWVTGLCLKNEDASSLKLYGDKAYLFCDDALVKVVQIPFNLMKDLKSMVI